jgi:hypothetical protein
MKWNIMTVTITGALIFASFIGTVSAMGLTAPSPVGVYIVTPTPTQTPALTTCQAPCQCLTDNEAQQRWPAGSVQANTQVCGYERSNVAGTTLPQYCYCSSNVVAVRSSSGLQQIPTETSPLTIVPSAAGFQRTVASSGAPAAATPMHLGVSVSPSSQPAHLNVSMAHAAVAVQNITSHATNNQIGPWDLLTNSFNRLVFSPFAKEWYVSMPGPTASLIWWDWSMGSPQSGHTTPPQPGSSIGSYYYKFGLSPTEEAIVSHGVPSISNAHGTILLNQITYHFSVDPDLCVSYIWVLTSSGNWQLQNPDDPGNGWCSPFTMGENNPPREYSGTIDLPSYESHEGVNVNYYLKAGDVNAGFTNHEFVLISSWARFTGL